MLLQLENTYTKLNQQLYSICSPTRVANARLVVWNETLANALGIEMGEADVPEIAAVFGGNKLPESSKPIAQAYCGHQFGHFNRLGDGRAILLGELIAPGNLRFDVQLKGSGTTPYSRRGDGRATLISMLREYLMSEAMHALNIPTTRSLAVVATGENVYREQVQQGAVLTRIAASHIRVGTFEFAAHFCDTQTLDDLCKYSMARHYPEIKNAENHALALLQAVMSKQIDLMVHWLRVGFIHGVMNTDNMSISGETIDYGPCAFLNSYKPETVFSSIDTGARYAFGNQPAIAHWNLSRLAESLLPIIDPDTDKAIALATELLNKFQSEFQQKYLQMLANKIGFTQLNETVQGLIQDLLKWMYQNNADYTNTFVKLMYDDLITDRVYEQEDFKVWKKRWEEALINKNEALQLMQNTNPIIIARNHMVEKLLTETVQSGNTQSLQKYIEALSTPYVLSPDIDGYMQAPPEQFDAQYKTFCGT